ncbi:aminoglycoside phosphotransferase family protein [Hyalangium gracile]|uniref:phosphotransferase n=1 Tax=Hyalangium gracile TaxID=394092 RepID=UPI001CCA204A|nr:phosphotransferase [Hyalangium gracile]
MSTPPLLGPDALAARTRAATSAAVNTARELGLDVREPRVLHDVFSVVVHLAPAPVVARVPVVQPPGISPTAQEVRQRRELEVVAWLDARGVPVVPPSSQVPRAPVRRDGFSMTFWQLADVAPDHSPYAPSDIALSAELHAALAPYPGDLAFLAPFSGTVPACLAYLDAHPGLLAPSDLERAHAEWKLLAPVLESREAFSARFPTATIQPIQGDAPSHNVIRTVTGIRFSDFEDVTLGPVEWDLAMIGPEATAAYDAAAKRLGRPTLHPEVQRVMDAARTLQFVACSALVPQLPLLADGLAPALEKWRTAPLAGGLL